MIVEILIGKPEIIIYLVIYNNRNAKYPSKIVTITNISHSCLGLFTTIKREFNYEPKSYKNIEKRIWKKDCTKCELYEECDHLGSYIKNGKWCNE